MDLIVQQVAGRWRASFGDRSFDCAIGRGGVIDAAAKREGDGATPIGRWPMRRLLFRADRVYRTRTDLPQQALRPEDGWCDDPADANYNRPVSLPYAASHERLWRADELYDLLVVLAHNDSPPQPTLGSAIFLHCAKPGYPPTLGCVALARGDLEQVLAEVRPGAAVVVEAPEAKL